VPEITVVVCTCNRAALLGRCLEHLLAQTADPNSWELIVVDNNSTDNTRAVVESFQASPITIRYCVETEQGVSHARNRGFREAQTGVVAYTDDDVFPDPGWLEVLQRCLAETGADAVGGSIRVLCEGTIPDWWGPFFATMLGELDLGQRRIRLRPGQQLNTGNAAYRTELLQRSGGFLPALGRSEGRPAGMEDTVLMSQVLAAGTHVVYEPAAMVSHRIGPERLAWSHFEDLLEAQGASLALLDPAALLAVRLLASLPAPLADRIAGTELGKPLALRTGYRLLPQRPGFGLRLRVALTDWSLLAAAAALAAGWSLVPGPYARRAARCKWIMTRSMVTRRSWRRR